MCTTSNTAKMQSIVISMSVCMSVCLLTCLKTTFQITPNFMLPVAMAWSSDNSAIHYVLPVLHFHIMETKGQNQRRCMFCRVRQVGWPREKMPSMCRGHGVTGSRGSVDPHFFEYAVHMRSLIPTFCELFRLWPHFSIPSMASVYDCRLVIMNNELIIVTMPWKYWK